MSSESNDSVLEFDDVTDELDTLTSSSPRATSKAKSGGKVRTKRRSESVSSRSSASVGRRNERERNRIKKVR